MVGVERQMPPGSSIFLGLETFSDALAGPMLDRAVDDQGEKQDSGEGVDASGQPEEER